jgi:hypothetical protein
MSKTPYEIRFDLLAMAQSIITENLMNERIRLENDWNLDRERASIALSQNKEVELPPFPNVPTIDPNQIIELAKKLNEFVSKTGE